MLINLGILDWNVGNLRSLLQVFSNLSLNFNIVFIKNQYDFNKVERIILPGQGSIDSCIFFLKKNFLIDSLIYYSKFKPILGICIGKHLLFDKSEEAYNLESLNIFYGFVKKFKYKKFLKIPHIGWNKVKLLKNHFLLNNLPDLSYFYFSHSFYVLPKDINSIYGLTEYGINFSSIFIKKNIFLVQFHPEKSSILGFKLIYNFSIWNI